jgi:hypothetical protein
VLVRTAPTAFHNVVVDDSAWIHKRRKVLYYGASKHSKLVCMIQNACDFSYLKYLFTYVNGVDLIPCTSARLLWENIGISMAEMKFSTNPLSLALWLPSIYKRTSTIRTQPDPCVSWKMVGSLHNSTTMHTIYGRKPCSFQARLSIIDKVGRFFFLM